jgi:hypothetical protein
MSRKQTQQSYEKGMEVLKHLLAGERLEYRRQYHSEYWYIAGRQQSQAVSGLMKNGFVKAVHQAGTYVGIITDAGKQALENFKKGKMV